jgi:hypothetical protein
MMKSGFFAKKDEVILSTVTALIVGGLIYQGFSSLWSVKEHTIFQKDPVAVSRK